MKPEKRSKTLLGITRSKAKMYEYDVHPDDHIRVTWDPARLLDITIGILGDLTAKINSSDDEPKESASQSSSIEFSAHYFDAYFESKLNQKLDHYLLLLGAAAYYLNGMPGSARVLINKIGGAPIDLEAQKLDLFLTWLLKGDLGAKIDVKGSSYEKLLGTLFELFITFFKNGSGAEDLLQKARLLRRCAYENGTPRELLLADIVCSIIKKKYWTSSWYCLPRFTGLGLEAWRPSLQKPSFIRELWPSQLLLGERDVLKGRSAILQMPTSAGKTRAAELVIRSAFLAGRTSIAVVVAPFKALCHEIRDGLEAAFKNESVIVDELTDVFQPDFDDEFDDSRQFVLVVTPEKLVYVLRHSSELAPRIGLLIYDEGHQFDSGSRGVTYELLLTSLKALVPKEAQKVLISAVLSNADKVNEWLNDDGSAVVSGAGLSPTYRTVAFTSWTEKQLKFISSDNPDETQFFVPRVLESFPLEKRTKREKPRVFPMENDGKSVSLYLALKLVKNGGVAIFCGTKATVGSLCDYAVEVFARGLRMRRPLDFSDPDEIRKIHFLICSNLGESTGFAKSAALGVLAHHASIPHGIRLAVEHAMKEGLARLVICTSTLAQGVNLPLRYLIVTSIYQGRDRIKVRDFHNLIGRTGRSGMYTEGSILFADPEIFDRRDGTSKERWRWGQTKLLLDSGNTEPCVSALLSIFEKIQSDDKKFYMEIDPIDFVKTYCESTEKLDELIAGIVRDHSDKGFSKVGIEKQAGRNIAIISAVESFLMAHWGDSEGEANSETVLDLAKGTLAYHLAGAQTKEKIIQLFAVLAENINKNIVDAVRRAAFSKTLCGVRESIEIEAWVQKNVDVIAGAESTADLFMFLWPILKDHVGNSTFQSCTSLEALREVGAGWIMGRWHFELLEVLEKHGAKFGKGDRPRHPQIEHVVDICEGGFAYDGMLILGAIVEAYGLLRPDDLATIEKIQGLQKQLKYGLFKSTAIALYELGFADRVVASDIGHVVAVSTNREEALVSLRRAKDKVRPLLDKYPTYFLERYSQLV